jgi:hypothetical protein
MIQNYRLFLFSKASQEKTEQSLVQKEIKGCCQAINWFDELVFQKWINIILEPQVWGNDDPFLLVDQFKVHMMKSFVTTCKNIWVDVGYIPARYTCFLQLVDVGFNAQYKWNIWDCHHKWCIEKYRGVSNVMRLPTPD